MKLATLQTPQGTRAAVVRGDGVVIVDAYSDVGALLRDPDGHDSAVEADRNGDALPLEMDTLLRPVLEPSAIVCVGLNYRTHILEMGREIPEHPTLFAKLPRALTNPYATIEIPRASSKPDYEGELAIVIGKGGRDIPESEAWRHVAGLTAINDVTMRDFQNRTIQWFAGKTWQATTPMGPWIVTPDEMGDLAARAIRTTVNGEERQHASLGDLVFGVPRLIEELSRIFELVPGDVISSGTPGGVGHAKGIYLGDGDVVEVTIDGVGSIKNTFASSG